MTRLRRSVVVLAMTTVLVATLVSVVAGSPSAFAVGQLSALDTYESSYGVRQVDGYMYPSPALGLTAASGGALTGTAQLTPAGLAALPGLKGTVPFDAGTYGYPSTIGAGAPLTPWLENAAGQVLAGVYQHPSTDPQAGVSELSLTFDYNATMLQWLLLAPGLIDWVTQDTHLGLYRNYFGQDIDDNFIADNSWSSQYQCTPGATEPPDYTCGTDASGKPVANNPADTPPDVQMTAADVAYVAAWEKSTGITLNLAFNAVGACTADVAGDASGANCAGSVTDNGTTYTDPGQVADTSYPNDSGLVNALLADKADFNWITHTWSHEFLGCVVWQPQAVNSVTPNASGGSFTAGGVGGHRVDRLGLPHDTAEELVAPGVGDPVEVGLVGQQGVDQSGVIGIARIGHLSRVGVGGPVVGDRPGAVGTRRVARYVRRAGPHGVEGQVQRDAGRLFPGRHVGHVGRGHLHVGGGVGRVVGHRLAGRIGPAGVVGRLGRPRGALVLGAPRVVGDEVVVDVLAEVVAVEAEVGVLGHPVDEPGRQQQPLQHGGVVVEGEAELGHPGLGVGGGVLVDAGQHLARGVLQPGGERRPGHGRRRVAVGAGVEGHGALQPGQAGQAGRGQGGRRAIEGPARDIGQTEGR